MGSFVRKFVFVVALGILAWIFVVPSCSTEFGCDAAGAVAHADDGECPSGLEDAANDAEWAADRIASLRAKKAKLTTGLFYDEDGAEHTHVSGYDENSDRAEEALDEAGVEFPPAGRHPAAAHVETKIAAGMRDNDITFGVVVINHPGGPCGADPATERRFSCGVVVPAILPEGSTLAVWFPGAVESVKLRGHASG